MLQQNDYAVIDKAIKFLGEQVNDYVKLKTGATTDKVVMSNVVTQSGSIAIADNNVALTLVNIEEERITKVQTPYVVTSEGESIKVNPEIKLNFYILFSSYSSNNYEDSLRLLSHVITFFQSKYVFNQQNSPLLDNRIEKLIVDMFSIPIEQQNYLWTYVGAKYLPSVVYKVRLVAIQELQALESLTEVESFGLDISNS